MISEMKRIYFQLKVYSNSQKLINSQNLQFYYFLMMYLYEFIELEFKI